jgi:DMSO/TMAO reductase YedYZ molybdopterin-dependent catalytic subunit
MTVRLVPAVHDFTSRLRSPAVSARVGLWLGICFGVAFLTGLVSHWAQLPDPALPFPTRPVWGYRVTQGLHVASGTAAVPLLLVKLYAVLPNLFARPPRPRRDLAAVRALALHGAERLSIALLVSAAIFQLATGLANAAQWYPWAFSFRATHYAVAWVAIGALVLHVAVKLPVIRAALRSDVDDGALDRPGTAATTRGLSRRALLRTTWLSAGVAVLVTSTVPVLRRVAVLAVRSGDGPGGVPVNKSAKAAGVIGPALDPGFRLEVVYAGRTVSLSREELLALPRSTAHLPIACVEGWSATGRWTGVRLRHLLELVGAPAGRDVRVVSLQPRGPFRVTSLPASFVEDPLTLLALLLDGEPLAVDHGYPCRLIAPDRPGVLQTKWVSRLEVLA